MDYKTGKEIEKVILFLNRIIGGTCNDTQIIEEIKQWGFNKTGNDFRDDVKKHIKILEELIEN